MLSRNDFKFKIENKEFFAVFKVVEAKQILKEYQTFVNAFIKEKELTFDLAISIETAEWLIERSYPGDAEFIINNSTSYELIYIRDLTIASMTGLSYEAYQKLNLNS